MIEDPKADIVVWDSEALDPKADWESWGVYKGHAGVSIACVIEAYSGLPTFYTVGDRMGYDLEALAGRLGSADEVVSFNGTRWDTPVLSETLGRPLFFHERDLYAAIRKAVGNGWPEGSWKLDRIAKDTLGIGKTGNGAIAPTLWREGEVGRLATYVHRDAWLTWRVWTHIQEHGFVLDPNGRAIEVTLDGGNA